MRRSELRVVAAILCVASLLVWRLRRAQFTAGTLREKRVASSAATTLVEVPSTPSRYVGKQQIYYGAAYYPEVWDEATIEEDLRLMAEMRVNVVRMGEFAWALMEPEEGKFELAWLTRVIDRLAAEGIDVILGTPSATPPAWLGAKYPRIYRMDEDGVHMTHGGRRDCNYANGIYRVKSALVAGRLAAAVADKPNVIAWQIDNEFGFTPDYGSASLTAFRTWLANRYGSIEALNERFGAVLWSQTYSSFEQIPAPTRHVQHNPSLWAAWYRFWNEQIASFAGLQLAAIRARSQVPVTHDGHGVLHQFVNYGRLFADLDFAAVNHYNPWPRSTLPLYDQMRSFHKPYPHWLFETAPNFAGGWGPGEMIFVYQGENSLRAAVWINVALGGQGTLFWLWRQHPAAHEMPHGSVVSSWGKVSANFDDLRSLGEEMAESSDFLARSPVARAEVAIFWDHEALAMLNSVEKYANGIDYGSDWFKRFYVPIVEAGLHRDVLNPVTVERLGLSLIAHYKVLLVPLLPYISSALRALLKTWVEHTGGTLLLGPMSGYRTADWTSFRDGHALGRDLEPWMDIVVESRIPVGAELYDYESPLGLEVSSAKLRRRLGSEPLVAGLWSDALSTTRGQVLATYADGMHKDKPAVVRSPEIGENGGRVVLFGTDPGERFVQALLLESCAERGIPPLAVGGANGVLVVPRVSPDSSGGGLILVNFDPYYKRLELNRAAIDRYMPPSKTREWKLNVNLAPLEVKLLRTATVDHAQA